ncbi:hypothetical protein GNI_125820 [Gregarina niphandrodes]|uniref:Uncharacterized protein n=1 Tax=Gregarina niphandrodes TaxID=110365 RepID=A0A023B1X3_GRENI|nr:hypothetical protein GNI_125820 [Gregarina niphandrodes]EZG50489.1 hypothetical protein GNI_125820 [Gregarina niphandrodes]|eukprot:XP_011132011.1 hypothetical protein GNI_125820 [Gregarina niphandrodes]
MANFLFRGLAVNLYELPRKRWISYFGAEPMSSISVMENEDIIMIYDCQQVFVALAKETVTTFASFSNTGDAANISRSTPVHVATSLDTNRKYGKIIKAEFISIAPHLIVVYYENACEIHTAEMDRQIIFKQEFKSKIRHACFGWDLCPERYQGMGCP